MKKLRFYGLLVTVLLLAFGLVLGCSTGSTDNESDEPLRRTTYEDGNVRIVFSNRSSATAAIARAALPQTNDNYWIYQADTEISKGIIEVLPVNVIKFHPEGGGAEFVGDLTAGVLTVTNIPVPGGEALNVRATEPGSNTGTGGGGGGGGSGGSGGATGGGGTGGGGSAVAESPPMLRHEEADWNTYIVTNTGGTAGSNANNAPSIQLTFTFSAPVPNLTSGDVTFADGTGKAKVVDFYRSTNAVYIADLDPDENREGHITVSIAKTGIDPTPRKVPIFQGPANPFVPTFSIDGPGTPAATKYFISELTTLKIVFSAVTTGPALTIDNIGWNTPVHNDAATESGTLVGLKADIGVTNLRRIDAKNYTADVKVNKQGPVNFFLTGKDGTSGAVLDPTLSSTIFHATKVDLMKYEVTRAEGDAAGIKNEATTTALKIVFEYDPAIAGLSATAAYPKITVASADGVAAFPVETTGNVTDATGAEWLIPLAATPTTNKYLVRQGMMKVIIGQPGFSAVPQNVEVYRKRLSTYTVESRVTAGITTYLVIKFDDATTDLDAFTAELDATHIVVKNNRGDSIHDDTITAIQGTVLATGGGGPTAEPVIDKTAAVAASTATPPTPTGPRYWLRLKNPISMADAGSGTVQLTTAGKTALPDVNDQPVRFSLDFGGYVDYNVITTTGTTVASSKTAASITIDTTTQLVDPYDSTRVSDFATLNLVQLAPVNPNMSIYGTDGTAAVAVANVHALTTSNGTRFTSSANATSVNLDKTTAGGGDTTSVRIQVGLPTAVNYANYFFDPTLVKTFDLPLTAAN